MTISVIGTGFVGVVSSAVFASLGNKVYGVDVDAAKIESLTAGAVPFFEPKLEEVVKHGVEQGNLIFTTDYEKAIPESEVVIIAVGTPSASDGTADLQYVLAATESLAPHLKERAIVAIKSTVPPGTNAKVTAIIAALNQKEIAVVSLPEFLREGAAVDDTLNADRVVIGADIDWAIEKLLELHKPIAGKRVIISAESAQMAKYSANAYLAMRITFINQISDLCEKTGADVSEVIQAIGHDKRIGMHYWYPGLGYGGSCFPKDVKELAAVSKKLGEESSVLILMDQVNEARILKKMDEFEQEIGGWNDKQVTVLGLSFKPNTTDMREAPSLKVIPYLQEKKAIIKAYDPKTMDEAKKVWPNLFYAKDLDEAIDQAEVVLLLVEWDEFRDMDLTRVKQGGWIIDTRHVLHKKTITDTGLSYIGVGTV
jgi:UDPglucose 6-dehydrogenase